MQKWLPQALSNIELDFFTITRWCSELVFQIKVRVDYSVPSGENWPNQFIENSLKDPSQQQEAAEVMKGFLSEDADAPFQFEPFPVPNLNLNPTRSALPHLQ